MPAWTIDGKEVATAPFADDLEEYHWPEFAEWATANGGTTLKSFAETRTAPDRRALALDLIDTWKRAPVAELRPAIVALANAIEWRVIRWGLAHPDEYPPPTDPATLDMRP